MEHLSISLLGSFQVTLDGRPVTDLGTEKARALLAYLAVESDRPHRRDALAGLLWAESPQSKARQSLRQALSDLRRALGDSDRAVPFLSVSRKMVQFNSGAGCWLDAAEFSALSAANRAHDHGQIDRCLPCVRRMEEMANLYRGSFMEGFFLADSIAFEEWATLQREYLRRQVMEALETLVQYHERRGDLGQAIRAAQRQVRFEPWLEEAHRQLMRLLALDGRRSAALAQYRTCRRTLTKELGLEPTAETRALYSQIRDEEQKGERFSPGRPSAHHNLRPPLAPLIGREEELSDLADLLAGPHCRLVTLTGPAGIGKTRLALRAAADQVGLHEHGVAFVPLAGLDSADLVPSAIADELRFRFHSQGDPEEQLLDFLREKEMLLVLDNMEHLLEASGFLARILRHALRVSLLVTSRERLHLREEWVYAIDGLSWPPDPAVDQLESYSSVSLFLQTVRRAHRKFVLSEQDKPCLARICQMVEGMPLAIELAAAWIPVRTCEEVTAAIEHNLDILATNLRNVPDRHRSLRAAFEHSWSLLSQREHTALGRLSIFHGWFEAEAAEFVASASSATLAALLNKSLLRRNSPGHYEMHSLLQQYAKERLRADPEQERAAEDLYCDYYGRFLHEREGWFRGPRQAEALEAIGARIENVRAAWRFAIERKDAGTIGRLLASLGVFYAIRCWNQEGAAAFDQAATRLALDSSAAHDGDEGRQRELILGQLLAWQGHFVHQLGQRREAQALLERSLSILRRHGAGHELAFSLYTLAQILCHGQNDYEAAAQLFQESLALYEAASDSYGRAQSLDGLGDVAARQGSHDEARRYYEEALALRREIGDLWGLSVSLGSLGGLAGRQGAYDQARRWFEESLAISRSLENPRGIAACLHNLSTVAYLQQDYDQALLMRQESLDICRQIGYRWGIASSLKSLGDVASRLGQHAQAMRYLGESLALLQEEGDRRSQAYTLNSLGTVAHALGKRFESRQYFQQALKAATDIGEPALALDILMSIARLLAEDGELERGLELLAFVAHHPACEQQTRDQLEPLRSELAAGVSPEAALAAEARARTLKLDEIATSYWN
jgi:DNA-binding SARP family transcriptional activator/predicted ATPase/Tfp pilus assembly protein PilF